MVDVTAFTTFIKTLSGEQLDLLEAAITECRHTTYTLADITEFRKIPKNGGIPLKDLREKVAATGCEDTSTLKRKQLCDELEKACGIISKKKIVKKISNESTISVKYNTTHNQWVVEGTNLVVGTEKNPVVIGYISTENVFIRDCPGDLLDVCSSEGLRWESFDVSNPPTEISLWPRIPNITPEEKRLMISVFQNKWGENSPYEYEGVPVWKALCENIIDNYDDCYCVIWMNNSGVLEDMNCGNYYDYVRCNDNHWVLFSK